MAQYSLLTAQREALMRYMVGSSPTPADFKHGLDPDSKFNAAQLARGVEVEMEHTDDLEVSKAIAKAHLSELPDYYTRLDAMEAEGERDLGITESSSTFARLI